MSDRMLDKLAKILNQAENAATPEEAEAFLRKAQMLATNTSIDLAVARQYTARGEKREQPTHKHITIGEARKKSNARLANLFFAVSNNNDVKINIANNSTFVIAFGMPSDIEVVETLYASLLFQMVESANAWLRKGEYKTEQVWNDRACGFKPMDGRTARSNFYDAYTKTIFTRLYGARKEALEAVKERTYAVKNDQGASEHQSAEMVLFNKADEVNDYYKTASTAKGTWKGARAAAHSNSARTAGDSAGRTARIGSNLAIGGSRTAVAS
jgi:hypothetical protein